MDKINFVYLWALLMVAFSNPLQAAEKNLRFQRVIYVVLENQDFKNVMKNSQFSTWANQGAQFTQFFAATHPSQPNYIAMVAGDTLGVTSN